MVYHFLTNASGEFCRSQSSPSLCIAYPTNTYSSTLSLMFSCLFWGWFNKMSKTESESLPPWAELRDGYFNLGSKAEKAMTPHSSAFAWKIPWRRSLVGYSPWSRYKSDTTEWLHFHFSLSCIGEGNGNLLQRSCLENPGTGEPGGLLSMGSHRVGHDWSDLQQQRVRGYSNKSFRCPR